MGWNVFTETIPLLSIGTFYAVSRETETGMQAAARHFPIMPDDAEMPDRIKRYP